MSGGLVPIWKYQTEKKRADDLAKDLADERESARRLGDRIVQMRLVGSRLAACLSPRVFKGSDLGKASIVEWEELTNQLARWSALWD